MSIAGEFGQQGPSLPFVSHWREQDGLLERSFTLNQ